MINLVKLLFALSALSLRAAPPARRVFAHYMVCFATYGPTVDGYVRDIQDAQAAGIDGFALNIGAWSGADTMYKARIPLIYDAAEKLGTDFKLFLSIEITNATDIIDAISTYADRPNSLRHDNKVVVSTYGQNSVDWKGSVFAPLKAKGIDILFIPHFWCDPVRELPNYQDGVNLIQKYRDVLDGLFLFGGAGLPGGLAQSNSNYTRAAFEAGKLSMASLTPHYWGCLQTSIGRRYFENDGYLGLMIQWQSIIQTGPNWVEIVTWNDWNESTYISPIDNPGKYFADLQQLRRYSHIGFLEFSKPYIQAFKSQAPPVFATEGLFYCYRTHPKSAVATDTSDVPVNWFIGEVRDVISTTLVLTNSAELVISSGGVLTTNRVAPGVSHVQTPFHPGSQFFRLLRSGNELLGLQGPLIAEQISRYNFFPATGYAYVGVKPPPPANLRDQK